jgi:hypothetical protein
MLSEMNHVPLTAAPLLPSASAANPRLISCDPAGIPLLPLLCLPSLAKIWPQSRVTHLSPSACSMYRGEHEHLHTLHVCPVGAGEAGLTSGNSVCMEAWPLGRMTLTMVVQDVAGDDVAPVQQEQ